MPASEPVRFGRKRALPSCPNPLFLQWLTELRDEAKEKDLKIQYTYQKAINSLNKYPLPLKNAKEAKILKNFGDGICKILDDKLQRHYRQNGPNASIHSLPKGAPPPDRTYNNNSSSSNSLAPSRKRNDAGKDRGGDGETKKKKREYVPQQRSGGYAVLLTLYRQQQIPGSKGYMFKMELQSEAQPLCDKSFSVPDLGSKYTAWSSVSTLIQKNLLTKTHNPARYSLTDEGLALAERLESVEKERRNVPVEDGRGAAGPEEEEEDAVVDLTASDEEEERGSLSERATGETQSSGDAGRLSLPGKTQVTMTTSRKPNRDCLLPGTYDVILCVDFIETTGGSHYRKQELVKELQRNGVGFDVRKLNVGDFLWVAREKVAPVPGQLRASAGRELVLDYIIERKRMDDLCGSIIDGRFREQKVVDGFFVKRVQDVRESAAYLTVMTRYLSKLYQNRTLVCRSRELEGDVPSDEEERGNPSCSLISFAEFNHGAVKNKCQTVREVFARQLMQISGLSGDKAAAILEQYGTPHSLLAAYEKCGSESEKEKLLSCIRYGKLKRNLGPALSRTVYQLYCTPGALT
ncbi:crossover junction endonuclease MUS81 isoform X2 [Poecilia reticulata]|uniref:crossover junction endonuclease MUS81 isoform X2 n=1 Tax=Poecilia reticulata TaxID=8081 RepID=UPI0004A2C084|nr:PREDICTED: crossover junction endonuclease MUS81 isoform X2 [Poecilia reticulata]